MGTVRGQLSLKFRNVGLEQDNYTSLTTNGTIICFYNKKGIYLIYKDSLIEVSESVRDYIYKDLTSNRLAIDGKRNELYVI